MDSLDLSGTLILVIGLVALLVGEHYIRDPSNPLRWHAAVMWTVVAFASLFLWSTLFRRSWRFWVFSSAALATHIFAMWYLFGVLLPHALIGTLWVSGLGLIEGFALYILFLWLAPARDKIRPRAQPGRRSAPRRPAD